MPVSYEDISNVAFTLLNAVPGTEAERRSAISRAYYGFYHVSLEYANTISVPPVSDVKGPVHATLGAYYQNHMHADKQVRMHLKQIGWSLKNLHELRCKSDYHLSATVTHIDAEAAYLRCVSKIALVQQLMSSKAA